jgi:hypothetical protein
MRASFGDMEMLSKQVKKGLANHFVHHFKYSVLSKQKQKTKVPQKTRALPASFQTSAMRRSALMVSGAGPANQINTLLARLGRYTEEEEEDSSDTISSSSSTKNRANTWRLGTPAWYKKAREVWAR